MFKMRPEIIISIIALGISIIAVSISAYSAGLFSPFKLDAYVDGYFLPHTSLEGDSSKNFPIAIPIIFTNKGHGTGIIKDIKLSIENKDTNKKYSYIPPRDN